MMSSGQPMPPNLFKVLALDGGGAKGFYTLGVLREIEAMMEVPLCRCFDLIFGTSTGAIIAALLALGYQVREVHELYKKHVPLVMSRRTKRERTTALATLVNKVFGTRGFNEVKTRIGIVATRWALEKPMIFKGDVEQAHGRQASFVPGFGCSIGDAVQASCSAYPFFEKLTLTTSRGEVELIDGGYCANNPTLYAIADAVVTLGKVPSDLRVVSVGVGIYPAPRRWLQACLGTLTGWRLLQKTLNINTLSMEQLCELLFRDIPTVRINEVFERPEMATDLMESDLDKLDMLFQRGSESFAKSELKLRELLPTPR